MSLQVGESLEIVNTHGTQVVDMWAFRSDDPSEYLSIEHTRAELLQMTADGRCCPT